tara:strand:+ start:68 stop:577 length:510 start_codon:yes stop_codon:yes gene_type:complete
LPFDPESFIQNLAKYPELLKIFNDLAESLGGKDDLLDLIDQIKKNKFDFATWQERLEEQKDSEKIRQKWSAFLVGFWGDEDLQHFKSLDLHSATVEIYKTMGRKFDQLLKQITGEDGDEIRAGLNRYAYLIIKRSRITCGKCGHKYYADDAVNRNDQIRCPECNTRFPK